MDHPEGQGSVTYTQGKPPQRPKMEKRKAKATSEEEHRGAKGKLVTVTREETERHVGRRPGPTTGHQRGQGEGEGKGKGEDTEMG